MSFSFKEEVIKWNDWKIMFKYLDTNDEVILVSSFLKTNNEDIVIKTSKELIGDIIHKTMSLQIGSFKIIFIPYKDIKSKILDHVKNSERYLELKDTKEYKKYIEDRSKYEDAYIYLNP